MITFILEAAFRSLLMALVVWGGIRLLRVETVFAQKVAWVLVLLAAGVMPLVMRSPLLSINKALNIPIRGLFHQKQTNKTVALETVSAVDIAGTTAPVRSTYEISRVSPKAAAGSSAPTQGMRKHEVTTPEVTPILQVLESSPALTPVRPAVAPAFDLVRRSIRNSLQSGTLARSGIILASAYGIVASLLLLRILIGLFVAMRIFLRATKLKGSLPHSFNSEPMPRIRVSRDIKTPVTIASSVILPANYQSWDEAKLRIVLAHEQSHVYQKDFYLQLLAAIHAATFWFSPLGWWLQRKLSDLGEALSDRAGLAQAADAPSYAEVLLEFAAMPRTNPFSRSLAGVAMARSTNLSSRIDRILNDRHFRLAFLGGRRHAVLAGILVPTALVAAVACIRIVPAVEAAQAQNALPALTATASKVSTVNFIQAPAPAPTPAEGVAQPDPTVNVPEPTPAPEPPSAVEAPEAPDSSEMITAEPPTPPAPSHGFAFASSGDDGQNSFAIVDGNGNSNVYINGRNGEDLDKVRKQYHGNYIWFERDGKSYVITDPAILAQSRELFKGNSALEARQHQLDKMQSELNAKMNKLKPEMVNLNSPEFKAQMDKLNAELAELQKVKIKEITDKVNAEVLSDLQSKMGDIQGQIGEIQGKIGEQQGLIGEKQGAIGEQMGKLGEEMGRIGEQQGKIAEEASRKLKSVFDQAIKDGKAKPVD
jgi:beta-lactamase regulating signal transducer with metallopeptidase domain